MKTSEKFQTNRTNLINEGKITLHKTCVVCGKIFERKRLSNGKLSSKCTCSDECHSILKRKNGRATYEKIKSEGRFVGWRSRTKISYPEQFWIDVLQNNNIEFERELFFDNKYFLDFVIRCGNVIIDLEIDGKQHKYPDRVKHDKIRDEYLTSKGVIVYRIEWNTINTDSGKQLMKKKIDDFIMFLNTK